MNVGLYEPGLNDAGRADPALHVQKLLQFAARAVTEPSLKKALRLQNEALEKSCDYEQTALFAPEALFSAQNRIPVVLRDSWTSATVKTSETHQ